MPTKEQFATNINEIRESKGFTIRQVATYSGLNPSTISMLENAKRNIPKVSTLEKLANGLKEPVNKIIELAGYKPESHKSNEYEDTLTDAQKQVAYLIDPDATQEEIDQIKQLVEIAKLSKKRL
ncbi:helix-turn-helix domain-containing protein [Fructobacillus fructosus]|uniref:helix-turn-helix domain-containing protein n=1 Tax=Fructobacillus fructosus TaxID=1631 RepID=UPI001658C12A|nr:helix-turn-helix domain-containing protein [Fructobacillus fructosus]MBC9118614.1 helix-turn-helix transcriptional regulator [Fructobacillus fructosus]MBD9365091.1 helix-turn-helix transcriptional regulator [Leuconostoc mesenteroides]CAK1233066.1 DNA-binding transcriptional regulator [Fructobacillus fructosus]